MGYLRGSGFGTCGRATACVALLLAANTVAGASNEATSVVLHARQRDLSATCDVPVSVDTVDCANVFPTVNVSASLELDVFVLLNNYDEVAGLQCKFDLAQGWSMVAWVESCQLNQLSAVVPGGAEMNLSTAFDCVTGGSLTPVGRIWVDSGLSGCAAVVDSDFPYGTHVVDCSGASTPVPPAARARVCIGSGGVHACGEGGWGFGIGEY